MNMHVPVDARLVRAGRFAADINPSMNAIDLAIERSSVRVQRLGMAAPAVDKLVGAGRDPLIFAHASNIRFRRGAGKSSSKGCSEGRYCFVRGDRLGRKGHTEGRASRIGVFQHQPPTVCLGDPF